MSDHAISSLLGHPQRGPALVLAGAVAVIGGALYFQYGVGLQPCPLCLTQRYPYYGGIAALGLALALNAGYGRATPAGRLLLAFVGLGFVVGGGIGFYHVGVEQQWWAGPASCSGNLAAGDPAEALERLLATPVVRCDEVPWSLFGISLAGYNVMASLALGGAALCAAYLQGARQGSGR